MVVGSPFLGLAVFMERSAAIEMRLILIKKRDNVYYYFYIDG